MQMSSESQKLIDQYLEQVKNNLGSLSTEEQEEILNNLQSHIFSEIDNRSSFEPTIEDVQSVINDMDPPESYAGNQFDFITGSQENPKVSRRAIVGTVLLPFGLCLVLLVIPISSSFSQEQTSLWQTILRYTLLPVSIAAPFASTALGLWAISEIRHSNGRVYGMPLAVLVTLFYPIIVLDLILFTIGWSILGGIDGWEIIPLAWLILVLVIDYFIIRTVWRAANRV